MIIYLRLVRNGEGIEMIKADKLNINMEGSVKDITMEICYAIVTLRFRAMAEAENYGATEEEIDSEFKLMALGGIANALSDYEDGFIQVEQVAQKLHEITERAYAHMGKELN